MADFYRQCTLFRGSAQTVSWIPEHVAKVNQRVRLKKKRSDEWEHWTVKTVGSRRESEEAVRGMEQQWKWTRPHSDI